MAKPTKALSKTSSSVGSIPHLSGPQQPLATDPHNAFANSVQTWAAQAAHGENRTEAARRILNCHADNSPILVLEDLGLRSLPDEIGRLTSLATLHLSRNRLEALPESIGELEGLVMLYADSNQLTHLPETLGALTGLQVLNVHHNQLTRLPASFAALKQLRMVWMASNPLETLPACLLDLAASALEDLPLLREEHPQLAQLQQQISNADAIDHLLVGLTITEPKNLPTLSLDLWRSLREILVGSTPNSASALRQRREGWLTRQAELARRV